MRSFIAQATLVASAIASFIGGSQDDGFQCGFVATEELKAISVQMRDEEALGAFADISAKTQITIPTYWHVVYTNETPEGGYLEKSQVEDQFDFMRKAFAPHGIGVHVKEITYTENHVWSMDKSGLDFNANLPLQKCLRCEGMGILNIYSKLVDYNYATIGSEENLAFDGCVVSAWKAGNKDEHGMVAIHEVGHWLGLPHTFQETKEGPDNRSEACEREDIDHIDDTPIHRVNMQGNWNSCSAPGLDTCPNKPGLDPRNNYMTYTSHECTTHFTKGQGARMRNMHSKHRAGKE